MKDLQKLILPGLVIIVIALMYFLYFDSNSNLGSFSDFDTNNSAVKSIRVQVLLDRGINNNSFYASDKTGKVVLVSADNLPPEIESAEIVVLQGHLNKDAFHAHSVQVE